MKENTGLRGLDLSWNGFANDGARAVSQALIANNSLHDLDLSCNRINLEGALCIGEALGKNHTLKVLKVSSNQYFTNCVSCVALMISNALKEFLSRYIIPTLLKHKNRNHQKYWYEIVDKPPFQLSKNPITTTAACHILTVLKTSVVSALTTLELLVSNDVWAGPLSLTTKG